MSGQGTQANRPRLPLTVISGYLGAGKTTLINRLLAEPHGQKLLVMVNDFGAINIDAALLSSATDDTLTLSNGCVCCTMGADLFMAVGDVLDRAVRPDHLVIEASGIADPARIAQVAQAEPELIYAGIVTVVDGPAFTELSEDPQIGAQVVQQVRVADVICVSKQAAPDPARVLALGLRGGAEVLDLAQVPQVFPAVLGIAQAQVPDAGGLHPAYVSWDMQDETRLTHALVMALLARRPGGLFRFKGFIASAGKAEAPAWEVHCVGPRVSVKPLTAIRATAVVGIGLARRVEVSHIAEWWATAGDL